MSQQQKQRGFSLIEVMASVAIIAFSMLGIFSLVIYNQKIYLSTKNTFIGALLSEEGAELVRNVRDSNWLNSLPFNDGIVGPAFRLDATGDIKAKRRTDNAVVERQTVQPVAVAHVAHELSAFFREERADERIFGGQINFLIINNQRKNSQHAKSDDSDRGHHFNQAESALFLLL